MRRDSISAPAVGTADATPVTARAVLLDALGTLVELERPWPHLAAELAARGALVSQRDAERAMRAEMSYYRAHHDEAVDAPALVDLRRRCAELVADDLRLSLPLDEVLAALLAALRFRAFPEAPAVLRELRERGSRLVVVSNWDVSLHDVLERTELAPLVDAVVISAELGAAKPDPAIFRHALAAAGGVPAAAAVHVGDSVELDVAGARAAGVRAVLVARDGVVAPDGVETISSLEALLVG